MGITLNASLFWLWVKVVWLKLVAVFVVEVDILCQDLLRILMNCWGTYLEIDGQRDSDLACRYLLLDTILIDNIMLNNFSNKSRNHLQ